MNCDRILFKTNILVNFCFSEDPNGMYGKLQNAGFRKKRSLFGGKSMYIFYQTHYPNNVLYHSSPSLIFNPLFFRPDFKYTEIVNYSGTCAIRCLSFPISCDL